MDFERFKRWYPRYRDLMELSIYKEVYDFLSSSQNIWAMVQACNQKKPALHGIVEKLEERFGSSFDFNDHTNRRIIGCMIKEILNDFGYQRVNQGLVSNSSFFKTAACYEKDKSKATKIITDNFEIIDNNLGDDGNDNPSEENKRVIVNSDFEFEDYLNNTGKYKDVPVASNSRFETLIGELKDQINREEEYLRCGNIDRRISAIKNLGKIGTVAIGSTPALLKALDDKELAVKKEAASILGLIVKKSGFTFIVQEIMDLLSKEERDNRILAAQTLGEIGAPGAVEAINALVECLRDEDAYVREKAAWALGEIGPIAADAAPALIEALDDEDEIVRNRAGWALGMIGPNGGIDALIRVLETGESYAKKIAARELGEIAGFSAGDAELALIKALRGSDPELRATAAWSLGNILKVSAAWSAGSVAIPEIEIITALLESLKDESNSVREKAAWALGNLKNATPDIISALLNALRAEDSGIRRAAAWALGNIAPQEDKVVLALIEALGDQSRYVREKSAWALGRIGRISSSAVPELVKCLHDENWGVRKAAVLSLGRIGSAAFEAVPALVQVFEDNEEKEIVRKCAALALKIFVEKQIEFDSEYQEDVLGEKQALSEDNKHKKVPVVHSDTDFEDFLHRTGKYKDVPPSKPIHVPDEEQFVFKHEKKFGGNNE